MGQLADLGHAAALAHWDQQTMMPPAAARPAPRRWRRWRGSSHELFVDDETGRLLDGAASELNGADPDSDDARLIRLTRRHWDKARRVPTELAAEQARAASVGQEAWVAARASSDFAGFAPFLQHNIELARRYVECHRGDLTSRPPTTSCSTTTSPGCSTTAVATLFDELKAELVPLIAQLAAGRRRG